MKKAFFLILLSLLMVNVHAEIWTITVFGQAFTPDSIVISPGDTVLFQMDTTDQAQEVSQGSWNANDSIPVTGFQTPLGGGLITSLSVGTHYYVSAANASLGMKGRIIVLPLATVHFTIVKDTVDESAGIIPVIVRIDNPSGKPAGFIIARNDITSTAHNGPDYLFGGFAFSNNAGTSYDTVYITVIDEQLIEPTETVVLHLVNPSSNTALTADSTFTLYILNNDTLTVSFLGAAFSYPETADSAYIKVTISSPVPNPTSVTIVLDTGNAVKGVNFNCPDTMVLTFAADSSDTLHLRVSILNDHTASGNLQANFRLVGPTNGARLGISAFTLFIIDDDYTGINTALSADDKLKLFPNPTAGLLNIFSKASWPQAVITDLQGNEVLKLSAIPVDGKIIDLSALPAGLYLLTLKSEASFVHKKIIKN